jgi:hypothetical protein
MCQTVRIEQYQIQVVHVERAVFTTAIQKLLVKKTDHAVPSPPFPT